MPRRDELKKILIIGAGPNIVGQVAEFDLITTQAVESFLEDDVHLVIVNPNPATVATQPSSKATIYLEPMTLAFIKRILRMEEPDAIVTAFGSIVAIDMAEKLVQDGILHELDIELLTINEGVLKALADKRNLIEILQANKIPCSQTFELADSISNLRGHLENIQFPLILLKKNKFAANQHLSIKTENELLEYLEKESQTHEYDPADYQVYEDLSDWEEILVDVLRDNEGNLNFLNFAGSIEPVAINSGDSILVSPAMTLSNTHVQQIRRIVRKIGQVFDVHGIMSIHFAVMHHGDQAQIKMLSLKTRITRSCLLAYRAGTFNIGYSLAKIALGYNLNEIKDPNSGLSAAIEPVLDSVAIKVPNWSFTDDGENYYLLNDQMKAGGEAIGIGRNFESALLKGLDSTTFNSQSLGIADYYLPQEPDLILEKIKVRTEQTLLQILAALVRGASLTQIRRITLIHPVYLQKLLHIAQLIIKLQNVEGLVIEKELLEEVKFFGFSDNLISEITNIPIEDLSKTKDKYGIKPSFIGIDGTAGLYTPNVSATYSDYGVQDEIEPLPNDKPKILIVGTGPFQISLNSEFDYMLYHSIQTLKELGYQTIIISNNSESISSSYRLVDRVYFEPISLENILAIAKKEQLTTVMTQFSGKMINQFKHHLKQNGLHILGQPDHQTIAIDQKQELNRVLEKLDYNGIPGFSTDNPEKACEFSKEIGFPVLVGGKNCHQSKKSAVVFDIPALSQYITENELSNINISKFVEGQKYEVTAICDGTEVTIPGIIEHLEQSGSHASDSISVFNPQNLSSDQRRQIRDMTVEITKQIQIRGLLNLHFLINRGTIYVLQVKTYAGHNVAFLSKSLGQNITAITTKVLAGKNLEELELPADIWPSSKLIHVKMPVFSYIAYEGRNLFDSKMKSSGSVMGRDTRLSKALYKGYEGASLNIPTYGTVFISVKNADKQAASHLAQRLHKLGFKIVATEGTAEIIAEEGMTINIVPKINNGHQNIINKIKAHKINLVINVTDYSDDANQDASEIKDAALATHIPVFSSLKTAKYIIEVLESLALTTQPI